MGKPILEVTFRNLNDETAHVPALFDTGSHHTIVRESALPHGTQVLRYSKSRELATASAGGKLGVTGTTVLDILIGERVVEDEVLVSDELGREMILGAGTIQKWNITIRNESGHTTVHVGRDRRDPDVTEVV
ncbi:MAG: hypothetical protein HYY93_03370 [Planctomycetes bacterium]|nr:hypothetical protein [Planctomycetota bacterium]